MANITMIFGALLVALGVGGFVASGQLHDKYAPTALIPAYLGVLLAIMGALAANPKLRMHAMHVAVLFALLGFLMATWRVIKAVTSGEGTTLGRVTIGGMAVLTGIYVVLCVRSFIAARKARQAGFDVVQR